MKPSIKSKETLKCQDCGYTPAKLKNPQQNGRSSFKDGTYESPEQALFIAIFGRCINCQEKDKEVQS